jgi:transcriptional regulator with XRE-family HTH domain
MQASLKIFDAVNQLEKRNGRRYSESEIAVATGLHRHTIAAVMKGKQDKTLSKLLAFFAAEGMPITVGDLFTVTSTGE